MDSDIASIFECGLQPRLVEDDSYVNFNLTLRKQLWNVTFDFSLGWERMGKYESYLNLKNLNVCHILKNLHQHFMLKFMVEEMHRTSNLPLGCPLEKVSQQIYQTSFELRGVLGG